jgi:hypothetical protein
MNPGPGTFFRMWGSFQTTANLSFLILTLHQSAFLWPDSPICSTLKRSSAVKGGQLRKLFQLRSVYSQRPVPLCAENGLLPCRPVNFLFPTCHTSRFAACCVLTKISSPGHGLEGLHAGKGANLGDATPAMAQALHRP